ncbi:MAG: hypothetical protein KJ077_10970 [Anaerolineae bacterium]|nr:hypothetical protein [Anaerolineae bacterium]
MLKLTSTHWQQLYKSNPATWTKETLTLCSLDELEGLARLLGIPYSGSRDERIERILNAVSLRVELAGWGEYEGSSVHAHELATEIITRYSKKELVVLARRAGVYYGVPKRGIVVGLLQWRDACRRRGQEFDTHLREKSMVQYVMPLNN